jgi:peptidoglycan/xylan/chitin deacetylase (PgdA/CDA1 family)
MPITRPPYLLTRLMPRMTWSFYGDLRKVYLTFDDGPTPEVTDWVLEQLWIFDARATFFCIGRNVEHYPDIYRRILREGHSVGNHTYSHLKGWRTSNRAYFEDIEMARQFVDTDLFRPPYGRITPAQVTEVVDRYRIIMWDVLSHDYNPKIPAEQIIRNVNSHVRSGSIIVFHDSVKSSENLYKVLPRVLEYLQENHYSMEAIPMRKFQADRKWLRGVAGRG